ncbi:MAG: mechanosensitive ion channel [Endomicrobium sp.]|nr:mechanosensitive ion channel [Endomicrobium sp.]
MNKKNLASFKKILIQKKTEFLNKTINIQRGISTDLVDTNVGDEIDTASQNSEKEMYFELAANDKITLSAINDALAKIEKGVYGQCECCNNIIPVERLRAISWTRYCIKCQEEAENPKRKKMITLLLSQTFFKNFRLWLESILLFIIIFFIGFLFKKYVAKFIQSMLAKTGFVLDSRIIVVSSSYISFWFFLIALYVALLKAPVNVVNIVVHKFFCGVFAFSVVVLVASVVSRFFRKLVHEKIGSNIIKFSITFFGLILILNQAGIKLTPILTTLGIGTVSLAFALKDTLANFLAGINILASKQISMDDYIRLDSGQEGTVIEVNWRTTLIRELSNAVITIPNSKVLSSVVTSFQFKKAEVTASVSCGVAYGSDLECVEKIAKLAAQEMIDKCGDSVKTYVPVVLFKDFADSSINFTLFFRVKNIYAKAFMQSEVLKNLYKKLDEEKIEIPLPQRVVTINKE